ncbi:FAD-dependent oxidoreductase [Catenovulum maritimum]|uniref:Amine oxidase domain-containing protein n=1 Tax=Catenovulum maritimum TaxID=1513271 RepID=A0A0J8GSA8_9ALTE|nr:FAD-dependent oxidoreductase [Catenovulum maritimum]KMT64184.1 hypothetical protein XM47_15555 [Catenovulum maritimum]
MKKNNIKVAILGGGVGGMSAAHMLIRKGFDVSVYDILDIPGGKARSMPVPNTGTDGRPDLPGEHGFRFFPYFYKNLPETMKEIPYKDGKTCFDNLVPGEFAQLLRYGLPSVEIPAKLPSNLKEALKDLYVFWKDAHADLGIGEEELKFFMNRIWQILTSCADRRLAEYEKLGWWDYTQADKMSKAYQECLVEGLTRSLVAAQAEVASTRSTGDILVQLILGMTHFKESGDRLLNGPTNDVWIDPWLTYLQEQGVSYHFNYSVVGITCDQGKISSAQVQPVKDYEPIGPVEHIEADYFIAALPVNNFAPLITQDMLNIDSTLTNIQELANYTSWMNGIQIYLNKDVKIVNGHSIYVNSPWAITSVSQQQFWKDHNLQNMGNGDVKGCISIDISEWQVKGSFIKKAAIDCSPEEIIDEVWQELKASLNVDGKVVLKDEDKVDWFIDPDLIFKDDKVVENKQPLLVDHDNTWHLRPQAYTLIPNLFLASDYVATYTQIASMEGANEAARRAVNALINNSNVDVKLNDVYALHEPSLLAPMRLLDQERFNKGLPWDESWNINF